MPLAPSTTAPPTPDAHAGERRPELHRILRPSDGLAIVVGVVIGAGILRTPGLIAGYLGDTTLILAVWLAGGVTTALAALVFAELGAMIPAAGGKYAYVREAYGHGLAAFTGWAEIALNRSFTGALKVVLIAQYLVELAGRGSSRVVAGAVVIAFLLLHLRGLRAGRAFQNVSTALKVLLLVAIVGIGFLFGDGAGWHAADAGRPEGLWLGIALAMQSIFFTYYGSESALQVSEEMREPGRSIPRMLLLGVGSITAIYLLINAAFLHVLTPAAMAGSSLVARDVIERAVGEWSGITVALVALGVLLSSLNYNFLGTPRVPFGLARDGLAPRTFMRVNAEGTPTAGLYLTAALMFVLAVSGTFELLIRFMALLTLLGDGFVLTTIFVLRRRLPAMERPFRTPFYPFLPIAVLAIYAALVTLIVVTQPSLALGALGLVATVAVAVWLGTRRRGEPGR